MKTNTKNLKQIVAVGSAEIITQINQDNSLFIDSLGGSVAGISQQVQKLGGNVTPVLLTGDDMARCLANQLAAAEFGGNAISAPMLMQTCRAIVQGESTLRSQPVVLNDRSLSSLVLKTITDAATIVLCPLPVSGYKLAVQVLAAPSNSILLLSNEMLLDAGMALDLAMRANITICTRQQMACWTGCSDVVMGVQWLRQHDVKNCIVLDSDSITGFVSGKWLTIVGYEQVANASMEMMLDCIVGTVAAARMMDVSLAESLQLGIAACSIQAEGKPMVDLPHLRAESLERKPMPVRVPQQSVGNMLLAQRAAILTTSLLAGVALGAFLG